MCPLKQNTYTHFVPQPNQDPSLGSNVSPSRTQLFQISLTENFDRGHK